MPVQVYSLYIFDRHTECIYTKQWFQPGITTTTSTSTTTPGSNEPKPPTSSSDQQQQHSHPIPTPTPTQPTTTTTTTTRSRRRIPTDKATDDAKLIFGTIFSLRNMVRKLGGEDDAFVSFRTAHYKLHYYESPTNLRFALVTEPGAPGMRNVLHQIYINLWVEYVVKNPLSPVEHKGGEGVRNEMFELGLDKFIRGLM